MEHLVKNKITIGNSLKESSVLNIAYGVDENFLFGSGISMQSILMNNTDLSIRFHLVTDYINDEFEEKLKELVVNYNTEIIIYLLDSNELKKLPTSEVWSHATYFRFFIFDLLCLGVDSVLYIDADVFCKGSLKYLLDIKFNGEYAAVIPDVPYMQDSCELRLNIQGLSGKYFNAGVIYLNLARWKDSHFTQKAFSLINERKVKYLDQDALNILFEMNNIYLSRDFNCIYNLKNELSHINYQDYILDSTKLIHYTGASKPWHYWCINYPASQTFKMAYISSPWGDFPLKIATKRVEYQERYKHQFNQKRYFSGFINLLKYKVKF